MSPRVLHIINEATDPADVFVDGLRAQGVESDTYRPYQGEPLPEVIDGYNGILAGGGTVDTHEADDNPWLHDEISLMRQALDARVPVMGLCLGAQLLTEAAGGSVYRCEPHEVGWFDVELTPAARGDRLFDGLPTRFAAFQWHYYACRLPELGTELMTNPVSTQALRIGPCAWATQFHIEATRQTLLDWFRLAPGELLANGYDREQYMQALDRNVEEHERIGRTLASRFAQVVAEWAAG